MVSAIDRIATQGMPIRREKCDAFILEEHLSQFCLPRNRKDHPEMFKREEEVLSRQLKDFVVKRVGCAEQNSAGLSE